MSDLVKSYIAAIIRAGILAFGAWLVKNHVDASQASALTAMLNPTAIAGFVMAGGSLAWSLWHKTNVNASLITAAQTGKTTAAPAGSAQNPSPPPSSIPVTKIGIVLLAITGSLWMAQGCATIPGQTTAAPFLEFTNGSAYLLGHPVTSNQIYSVAFAGTELGVQLLVKEQPGATNYLPAAQAVFQSASSGGIFNSTNLQASLNQIKIGNATDQALIDSLAQTALSLAGVYVKPLATSDTNSAPCVEAALLGIANGL